VSKGNSAEKRPSRIKNPIFWGLLLTAVLAFIVVVLALTAGPSGKVRLVEFGTLDSNEIGDTLAGIFAPLAFIWIVVTVFLQSQELAEQRRELSLTREELRLAREAQEKMVEAAQIQASIFSDEKLSRDQSHAFSEVCAIADEIMRLAKLEPLINADWRFQKEIGGGNTSAKTHSLIVSARDYRAFPNLAELSGELSDAIYIADDKVKKYLSDGWLLSSGPDLSDLLSEIRKMIERVNVLYEKISEADRVRVKSLDLDPLLDAIEEVEDHPDYWRVWAGRDTP
jgi:hypothetical protein